MELCHQAPHIDRLQKHTRLSVKKQTGFSICSHLPGGEVGRAWELKGNGKNSGERGEEGKEEERHRRKERRESKGRRKLKKKSIANWLLLL